MSTFKFTLYDKNTGEATEHEVPAQKAVCPRCRGEGKHTNPAIDGNGITASEMEELGDEFREDYLRGLYDITCQTCHGKRVIDAPYLRLATRAQRKAYREYLDQQIDNQREDASERHLRMMESGGYG